MYTICYCTCLLEINSTTCSLVLCSMYSSLLWNLPKGYSQGPSGNPFRIVRIQYCTFCTIVWSIHLSRTVAVHGEGLEIQNFKPSNQALNPDVILNCLQCTHVLHVYLSGHEQRFHFQKGSNFLWFWLEFHNSQSGGLKVVPHSTASPLMQAPLLQAGLYSANLKDIFTIHNCLTFSKSPQSQLFTRDELFITKIRRFWMTIW